MYKDCRISAVQGNSLANNSKVIFQNCVLDGGGGIGIGINLGAGGGDVTMINSTLTDYATGISLESVGPPNSLFTTAYSLITRLTSLVLRMVRELVIL